MKRQIANVNTHIFRHPFIPWGQRSYPLSLQPDLLLDAIDLNALILDTTDTVAVLDQSAQLAETNPQTYTVLNNVNCASLTDNGGGSYSVVTGGTFGVNDPRDLNILGVVYAVKFTISNLVGSGDISVSFARNNTTYDVSRTSIATIPLSNGSHTVYVVVTTQDDSQYVKFQDLTGLDFDISNVITSEIQGNHFTQTTSANRPVVDSATVPTQIDFTSANSEYLENTLDVSTFAAMSAGSIINICDSNTGVVRIYFSIANSANASDRFLTYFDVNDKAVLEIRKDGESLNRLRSTTVCVDGTVVEWKLVGGVKKCFIDGIEDTIIIVLGTNGSQWMDYATYDNMTIGSFSQIVPIYYTTTFKHLMIRSTPLSDAESLTYANYLIQRYSL